MSSIDIPNNLKVKLYKFSELDLTNKSDMMKIEDLLNKEDSNNGSDDQNLKNKAIKNLSSNSKNEINTRPGTPDSIGSASVMSHDSTISNAHISILEGTKQMVGAAELFTKQ